MDFPILDIMLPEGEIILPCHFDTLAGYQHAVSEIIALTKNTLCIFDTDLNESRLENAANVALLQQTTRTSLHINAIRILLRTTQHIERDCPRLTQFLTCFGHRAHLRVMPADTRLPEHTFFLADERHLLRRHHFSRPHGQFWINAPTTTAADHVQFNSLWVISQPGLQGTPLGL